MFVELKGGHMGAIDQSAAILEQFRHAVIDPAAPTAAAAAGGTLRLLVPLGILVAVCALGYRVFDRAAPRIAEEL